MADTVTDQKEVMEVTDHMNDSSGTVTVIKAEDLEGPEEDASNEEYILQQAFGEASVALSAADAGQAIQIRYTTDDGVEIREGDILNTPDGPVQFINGSLDTPAENQTNENFNNNGYQIVAGTSDNNFLVAETTPGAEQSESEAAVQSSEVEDSPIDRSTAVSYLVGASGQSVQIQSQQTVQHVTNESADLTPNNSSQGEAPLGSSQNPIRIIQQGNQYIPVQQLTSDQLQQIMQVVQQQQLTKQSSDYGSSVLFNPQTNTRIVYRVIYPSELHKDGEELKSNKHENVHGFHMVPVPQKRTYKKRNKEEDEEKIDAPELTKEEKEERKKMRPKTRSGRVSKPPKHMVKDFKHIHVLDYDEDYDDSDGGYSDFKQSDAEDDDESSRSSSKKDEDGTYLLPGISSLKPKKWKCVACEKSYIGRAGLSRHLKLYPTHGKLDPESEEMEVNNTYVRQADLLATSETPNSQTVNVNGTVNGVNSAASLSEDSRDSSSSISYTPRPRGRGLRGRPPWKGRGRGRPRGAYSMDPELRRKNKLKEIVRDSTDEELMEIVLPRLTKVITLWEFLLMKVEKGNPTRPHADDIYREYMKLHEHVKRLCREYLECIPSADSSQTDSNILRVDESAVAESLGLTAGAYKVKEISEDDSTYDYKLITTNKSVYQDYTNKSFLKRTVEVVSPQELISPFKKAKTVEDIKQKIMPVSFSDKLKTLTSASVNPVQNVPVPAQSATIGRVIVVSQPSIVNNAENSEPKPQTLYINANHQQAESNKITSVFVPNVSNIAIASTSLQTQKPIVVNRSTGASNLNSSAGTPMSLLNRSISNPVSLLKPSIVTPSSTSQKFIIVSGVNNASVNKTLNLEEVKQTDKKPKEVILDASPHLLPYVNTSSQAQTSFISSQTSSDTIVSSTLSNSSTLLPNNLVPTVGSLDSVSLLNGTVYAKGSSQQPVGYIAVPISQPSQPQISVPSFNHLPGTVVMQPVLNHMSSSVVASSTSVTSVMNSVVSSAANTVQAAGVIKPLNTAEDSNQTNFQDIGDTFSSHDITVNSGSIDAADSQSCANANVVILNSQDSDQAFTLQLHPKTEQKRHSADPELQNTTDVQTTGDVDMLQTNGPEQFNNSDPAFHDSVTSDSETLGVINSIDASGTQLQSSETGTQVLVKSDSVVPDEAVHMESEEETIQIPATNIYQTEDGLIIIQNPDGTTMQLQGSDGQSIPLETIQALLAMDGGTQLITEQSDET